MNREEIERKKQVILEILESPIYRPLKFKELAALLDLSKERRKELNEVLGALISEGKVRINSANCYILGQEKILSGKYQATSKGFGFIRVEGLEEDIYIAENKKQNAMDGDEVAFIIEIEKTEKRAEGRILEVLKREHETVVGLYQSNQHFGFVRPDNPKLKEDIYIPLGMEYGAKSGDKVIVKITDFGSEKYKPEGEVIRILGNIRDLGVDILSIAARYGYLEEFSQEVLDFANQVPENVRKNEYENRIDLRKELTITIDGEDAKDLDDAITLKKEGNIWKLGVHIADVSHYVKEESILDKEALHRATSVYLVDRVIPMLPQRLSNGICSLNAGEDRLCLSCLMEIDETGQVLNHQIAETVIQVNYRMNYTDVNIMITEDIKNAEYYVLMEKYKECADMLQKMYIVSEQIRRKRHQRGAVDFDFPESKVILDKTGEVLEIKAYDRNQATKIIEDFMLLANETVAEEYFWLEFPFLYRVHEKPDPQKMQQLSTFIHNFGFTIHSKSGEIHPKELQKLLEKIEGSEAQAIINNVVLRSMKQARYQEECIGHFGLSAKYYTHFTSPIRRYPDLQIHRIIKENLHGKLTERRITHYYKILGDVARVSSERERRAAEAERESVKYKKCEYMQEHIGRVYEGIISGIGRMGFYVTLPNTVEGFVHIMDLKDDYYNYIENEYKLLGERFRKVYTIGQRIQIKVKAVDCFTRTIDFMLK